MTTTTAPDQVAPLAHPAFIFSGQGSQFPGMGRELSACGPGPRAVVAEAEEMSGQPLTELMTRADAATLADPEIAQLVVFTTSMVWADELAGRGVHPTAVAGHSLGEYTALVAAGCLSRTDALRVVCHRGRAMAQAARRAPGGMAAIVGLSEATVADLCGAVDHGETAVLANLNSPRQIVVSGSPAGVEQVVSAAKVSGAIRAKRLPVGGGYHSPLMTPAETELAPLIAHVDLHPPRVPMVSTMTGEPVRDIEEYRHLLLRQITSPVRWQDSVRALVRYPVSSLVEVGPGRVLSGLCREIARTVDQLSALEAIRTLTTSTRSTGDGPSPALHHRLEEDNQ